jgi:phasin family protein
LPFSRRAASAADTHAAVALFENPDPQALPLIVPGAGLDPTPVRPKRSPLVLSQFRHRLKRRRTPELQLEGFLAMAKQTGEQIVQDSTTEALARSGEAANEIMKGNADALTESGNASRAAVQELTKAYRELTTKNARNVTAAMQALAAVKSPTDFIELQQRLIKEGVETAVDDSQRIAQLTTAVFTAAFEPVKKRIDAVQNAAHP